MKKTIAIILTALMIFACLPVFAVNEATKANDHVRLEGYIAGNKDGAAIYEWMGFYTDDLENFSVYDSMDITYGAAYRDGYVYGYTYGYDSAGALHSDFYRVSIATRSIEFIEGASAGGEIVFGMAYNSLDDTVYALCNENNPYIASVDLETGELTRVVTVQQSGVTNLGVQTFTIDAQGRFLCLSFSATNARLVTVDKSTGACTALCETGYDSYYAQSMTYCAENNCIYWAHADSQSNYKNGLYKIDMSGYAVTFLGTIGTDLELTCLYTIPDYVEPEEPEYYELTIDYVYEDGSEAAASYSGTYAVGETYSVASPEIRDYTPDLAVVEGVMGSENVRVTVTYTEDAPVVVYHDLTINYIYEDGTEAAAAYTGSFAEGETYSVVSPEIRDYTPNTAVVEGVMGTEDLTLAVIYSASTPAVNYHDLTVNYLYADGTEAAAAYTGSFAEGETYSVESPEISGFTADKLVVEGVMGTQDLTFTVTYTANEVPGDLLLGDANCDGIVDFSDAAAIAAYVMSGTGLSAQGILNANVNQTGGVTAADITALYNMLFA